MTELNLPLQFLLLTFGGWVNRSQQRAIDYLIEENRVLREQLGKRRLRLTDDQRCRLAAKGKLLGRKVLACIAGIVTPDTILRWYRELIARKYDGSRKRRAGRPRKELDIAALVVRMAAENPAWGYTRIRDQLHHLGHEIGRSTVMRILKEHGITPSPERRKRPSWKTFLAAHWDALAAADFFTVEVVTPVGLVRYWVYFVMELKTRKVEVAGITSQPCGEWMQQIGRNLTGWEGFLDGKRFLILDRDPLYSGEFRRLLRESGVRPVRLPSRSPNLNAYAERFVGSIRRECLDRMMILGERHLRRVISEYVAHYNTERAHQGMGGRLVAGAPREIEGDIQCRERLGGSLRFYHRGAA